MNWHATLFNGRIGTLIGLALSMTVLMPYRANASEAGSVSWPTLEWQAATPESQGMDSGALGFLVDWGRVQRLDSLLMVRHGKIVLDAYYAPFQAGIRHDLRSVTKSFVATLIAIAIGDRHIDNVDHSVLDLFRDKDISAIDTRKQAMTVQHLLDMSSGIAWNETGYGPSTTIAEMYQSADRAKFVLDQPMAAMPGTVFNYDSGNPYVLSALITRSTGRNALDYAREVLFGPLGITDVRWGEPDAQNVIDGEARLYLQPRDMAKLGYLYLHDGQWDGRQIIPAAWVARAASGVIDAGNGFRYANLWWSLPTRKAFMALGRHGQYIIVVPSADLVAVATASFPDGSGVATHDLVDHILASIRTDAALPVNPGGQARLDLALRTAATQQSDAVSAPPARAAAISGKVMTFDENRLLLKTMTLSLTGSKPSWAGTWLQSQTGKTETAAGPIGLDGTYPLSQIQSASPIVKGHWLSDTAFEADSRILGQSTSSRWVFTFKDKQVDLHFENSEGFKADAHGVIEGR